MRFAEYNAMAHNFAASFASGVGLLSGVCNEVFDEAQEQPDGFIDIDFLRGECAPSGSAQLLDAMRLHCELLPEFCTKHGAQISELAELRVRFRSASEPMCGFTVHLALKDGREARTDYQGWQGKRTRALDSAGRLTRLVPEKRTTPRTDIPSD